MVYSKHGPRSFRVSISMATASLETSSMPPVTVRARSSVALPAAVLLGAVLIWFALTRVYPEYAFPSPGKVASSFGQELRSGRLVNDVIASLFRVAIGFTLAAGLGIPAGLWLGRKATARTALLPAVNFFRYLSPLAWIPFAILWFQIGDKPAVFLIFMASFFPLVLATMAAVATIPRVYFGVARDYGFRGVQLLTQVTLPAILPQVITALRVTFGIAWVVVVAAEMVGCQDGMGYAIYDARNGLRTDIVVCYMILIGALGVGIDRLLAQLTRLPGVRWGYER